MSQTFLLFFMRTAVLISNVILTRMDNINQDLDLGK